MRKMMIVLAMVIGLLMAGEAKAEGAWVLWESHSSDGYLHWQIEAAFPSYKECRVHQASRCQRWYNMLANSETLRNNCPESIFGFSGDKNLEIYYKCFPESVDPRK